MFDYNVVYYWEIFGGKKSLKWWVGWFKREFGRIRLCLFMVGGIKGIWYWGKV